MHWHLAWVEENAEKCQPRWVWWDSNKSRCAVAQRSVAAGKIHAIYTRHTAHSPPHRQQDSKSANKQKRQKKKGRKALLVVVALCIAFLPCCPALAWLLCLSPACLSKRNMIVPW